MTRPRPRSSFRSDPPPCRGGRGRRSPAWPLLLAPLALAGCVSQADLDQAVADELRFSGRVMGFALDAHQETLRSQLALLDAFQGDPRLPDLERRLGTRAEVEAKLERVAGTRRSLIEENQRLRRRHLVTDEAGEAGSSGE